jgi:hypothetical protein
MAWWMETGGRASAAGGRGRVRGRVRGQAEEQVACEKVEVQQHCDWAKRWSFHWYPGGWEGEGGVGGEGEQRHCGWTRTCQTEVSFQERSSS